MSPLLDGLLVGPGPAERGQAIVVEHVASQRVGRLFTQSARLPLLLTEAEMRAGIAAQHLLRFDEAFEYFHKMAAGAAELEQSTHRDFADRGHENVRWASWLMGETFLLVDRPGIAMTNHFLPALQDTLRTRPRDQLGQSVAWEDSRDAQDGIGRCLVRLGLYREAADYFRQALPAAALSSRSVRA